MLWVLRIKIVLLWLELYRDPNFDLNMLLFVINILKPQLNISNEELLIWKGKNFDTSLPTGNMNLRILRIYHTQAGWDPQGHSEYWKITFKCWLACIKQHLIGCFWYIRNVERCMWVSAIARDKFSLIMHQTEEVFPSFVLITIWAK